MRLFIALSPPPGALDDLDRAWAPFRACQPNLRWTGREAWHVTLAFLGEVSEISTERLVPRLERAARRHAVFGLSLAGAGAFPTPRRASVLWGGLAGDRRALGDLAATVSAAARRAGALPADAGRKFRPHLTLARCRVPADVRPIVDALAGYQGQPWQAEEILLIRSHLPGGGPPGPSDGPHERPRYETLGAWKLSRPSGSGVTTG